jgi:O-antigen/teichoic acid export membrane protein
MRNLFKAILKTGSGSLASVLFGMATVKLIAYRLGPEALGSFSLTRQLIVAGSALFLTGGQTALVQGIASRTGKDRDLFTATSFALLTGGSILVAVLACIGGVIVGRLYPASASGLLNAIQPAAAAIALSGPMAFVFGSLNASRRIGRLAIAQALNAATLAVLVWLALPLLHSRNSSGFALLLAIAQIPGFVAAIFFLGLERTFKLGFGFSNSAARKFGSFAFATVVAAGLQAWTILAIRGSVAGQLGLGAAGLFDAGWSISMVYVMLILGSFSTYYLPTLAAAEANGSRLIDDVLRTTLLLVVPLIAFVMAMRPVLLVVLYSPEFLVASSMMRWMLLGDFFKVLSFVLAMPMLARADLRFFLAGEIGWSVLMLTGSQIFLKSGRGIEGLGAVFAISYAAYFAYSVVYCRVKLQWRWPRELALPGVSAIVVLVVVSALTWTNHRLSWSALVAAVVGAGTQAIFVLYQRRGFRKANQVTLEAEA